MNEVQGEDVIRLDTFLRSASTVEFSASVITTDETPLDHSFHLTLTDASRRNVDSSLREGNSRVSQRRNISTTPHSLTLSVCSHSGWHLRSSHSDIYRERPTIQVARKKDVCAQTSAWMCPVPFARAWSIHFLSRATSLLLLNRRRSVFLIAD